MPGSEFLLRADPQLAVFYLPTSLPLPPDPATSTCRLHACHWLFTHLPTHTLLPYRSIFLTASRTILPKTWYDHITPAVKPSSLWAYFSYFTSVAHVQCARPCLTKHLCLSGIFLRPRSSVPYLLLLRLFLTGMSCPWLLFSLRALGHVGSTSLLSSPT